MRWKASTMQRNVASGRCSSDPAPKLSCVFWPSWWSTVGDLASFFLFFACYTLDFLPQSKSTYAVDQCDVFVFVFLFQVTLVNLRSSMITELEKLLWTSRAGWTRFVSLYVVFHKAKDASYMMYTVSSVKINWYSFSNGDPPDISDH